jgi:hypothetical protein
MLPAGERREDHRLAGSLDKTVDFFSPVPSRVLLHPDKPVAFDRLTLGQGSIDLQQPAGMDATCSEVAAITTYHANIRRKSEEILFLESQRKETI